MTTPTQLPAQTPQATPVSGRRNEGKTASTAVMSLPHVEATQVESSGAEPRVSRIARRAHELYVSRGGVHGHDVEDWLQAEREIDAASDDQSR